MTQSARPRVRRAPGPATARSARHRLLRWIGIAPSLLTILACLLIAAAAWSQRADQTDARYRDQAEAAMAAGDFRTARVCYERLLQSSPHDDALLFGLARSLEGLGQPTESAQILQRLAPPESAGYAPAHLLIAKRLLYGPHDAKALVVAESHLRRVLESDPSNDDARSLLASLYANTGRPAPIQ